LKKMEARPGRKQGRARGVRSGAPKKRRQERGGPGVKSSEARGAGREENRGKKRN